MKLGPGYIFPLHEGHFKDHLIHKTPVAVNCADDTGHNFDIENPSRQKWFGQNSRERWSYTEELCATLSIIDRQPQRDGDHCGE